MAAAWRHIRKGMICARPPAWRACRLRAGAADPLDRGAICRRGSRRPAAAAVARPGRDRRRRLPAGGRIEPTCRTKAFNETGRHSGPNGLLLPRPRVPPEGTWWVVAGHVPLPACRVFGRAELQPIAGVRGHRMASALPERLELMKYKLATAVLAVTAMVVATLTATTVTTTRPAHAAAAEPRDLADRHLGHPAAHRRRGPQVGRAAADRHRGVPEGDGADRRLPGARRAVHRHVRRLGGLRPGRQGHPERGPLAADHGQHRCQQDAGGQLRRLPHVERPVPARPVPLASPPAAPPTAPPSI